MRNTIDLGPCPAEEECAQVGDPDYREKALTECRRYIAAIRSKMGDEPEGARLRIKSNPHDFGSYYEVACEYDEDDEAAADYAWECESKGPKTWDDTARVAAVA